MGFFGSEHQQVSFPEAVQSALTDGMGTLIYLEARLQSDSGNINHQGINIETTHNAYMDFGETPGRIADSSIKRAMLGNAALAMAADIRLAIATGQLSAAEVGQLQGVLAELTGDAELAAAYVSSAVDGEVESGYNNKQARGTGTLTGLAGNDGNQSLSGLTRSELTKLHYGNVNETISDYYKNYNAQEVISTDANGVKWGYKEFSSDTNKIELAEQLQDYINRIPAGKRGDLRVPDYTKIKGIKVSDTGEVRLIEAWKPGTDGAISGTREMKIIKAANPDGSRTVIDRVGAGNGNYFSPMSPDGTPYSLKERAIGDYLPEPDITANDSYHQYEVVMDFTKENFERAIDESNFTNAKKAKLLHILENYYSDAANSTNTFSKGHEGEAYRGISDGIKTGVIDHMFTVDDGGAIQYITPYSVEILIDLGILKQLK